MRLNFSYTYVGEGREHASDLFQLYLFNLESLTIPYRDH